MQVYNELFSLENEAIPITIRKYFYEKGYTAFFPHWHKKIEILYITGGSMQIICNNEIFQAYKGDIVFVNPDDVHSAQCNFEDAEYVCIIIDADIFISNKLDICDKTILQLHNSSYKIKSLIEDDSYLLSIIKKVLDENKTQDSKRLMLIKSNLYQFLIYCICNHIRTESYQANKDNENYVVTELLKYIQTNYSAQITSKDMAEICGYTPSYFCRYFKNFVGKTPVEYLNTIRIKKAHEMLCNTNKTITEIALAVGYTSLNYFSRQFRNLFDCSPKDMRKQNIH